MSLTTEQVRNVARLARLGLDEDQIAEYVGRLSPNIIAMILRKLVKAKKALV